MEFCQQGNTGALLPSSVSNAEEEFDAYSAYFACISQSEQEQSSSHPEIQKDRRVPRTNFLQIKLVFMPFQIWCIIQSVVVLKSPPPVYLFFPSKIISHKDHCQNGKMITAHRYKPVPTVCPLAANSHILCTFLAASLLLHHPNSSSYKLPVLNADTVRCKSSRSK